MNKINEIEKMLTTANTMLLELKKENEVLKEENLTLQNKIILLEKMVTELQGNKKIAKKTTEKKLEFKNYKQNLDFLTLCVSKKNHIRPINNFLKVENGIATAFNTDNYFMFRTQIKDFYTELNGIYDINNLKNGIDLKTEYHNLDFMDFLEVYSNEVEPIKINSKFFLEVIQNLKFSIAPNDNIALNGLRIELKGNKLNFSSTDSYRLTNTSIEYVNTSNNSFAITLPECILKPLILDLKNTNTEITI